MGIILKNKMKTNKILSRFFEYINIHFNVNYDYIFEATKSVLNFITFSSMNNKQIQDIFSFTDNNNTLSLLYRICNVPFYFILQKTGQNVLFPALIAITYNNENNLNLMKNSLNTKHLTLWLKSNIYSTQKGKDKEQDKKNKNKNKNNLTDFTTKFPSKMWSNYLEFYNV